MFRWTILQIGFLEISSIFDHFRNSSKNFSEFWQENFGRVVKTAFYMYIGTFWRKCFSFPKIQKFFLWFSDSERQTCGFLEGDFASVVKIAFSIAKESILMKKKQFLSEIMYIHISWNLGVFFVFLPTMLRQACQNFIAHVQMNNFTNRFLGNFINFWSFPEFQQKFLRVLTRKFRQAGQNCILHVHRNILTKVFFVSKNSEVFFVVFGFWAANLWILRRRFC